MKEAGAAVLVVGGAIVGYFVIKSVSSAVTSVTDPFSPGGIVGPISPPPPKPGGAAPHNPFGTETYKGHKYHAVKNAKGQWVWALGPPPGHNPPAHKAPRKVPKTAPKAHNLPANPAKHPKVKKLPEPVRAKSPGKLVAL